MTANVWWLGEVPLTQKFKFSTRLVAVFCQTTVISRFYSCLA